MASQVFGTIILAAAGFFLLYLVIFTAVKNGINQSVAGKSIEKKNTSQKDEKPHD